MTARGYFDKSTVFRVSLEEEQATEDIGGVVMFLVSEDTRNITGQSLNFGGGTIIR